MTVAVHYNRVHLLPVLVGVAAVERRGRGVGCVLEDAGRWGRRDVAHAWLVVCVCVHVGSTERCVWARRGLEPSSCESLTRKRLGGWWLVRSPSRPPALIHRASKGGNAPSADGDSMSAGRSVHATPSALLVTLAGTRAPSAPAALSACCSGPSCTLRCICDVGQCSSSGGAMSFCGALLVDTGVALAGREPDGQEGAHCGRHGRVRLMSMPGALAFAAVQCCHAPRLGCRTASPEAHSHAIAVRSTAAFDHRSIRAPCPADLCRSGSRSACSSTLWHL